jgi:large subunit ribosomal protein L32
MKGRLRRTHYVASVPTLVKCTVCFDPVRPHHVCPKCGQYRGRVFVVPPEEDVNQSKEKEQKVSVVKKIKRKVKQAKKARSKPKAAE